ncbi:nucleotide exchange factor GrpE [uncultured Cloacibacillus sp.]|uniref:nucleotide exchange factor GrpE n=1 Tax=uncultured Cloacibacillus sp. TaxID=889794 RepID=UPI0025E0FBB8|nr:nucleotide exchange factor GrpE [uncultured Cloacibacillus sp.]
MTDQEKENRAGTENEEPKAAEAAANETAASEAVRDDEIKKLTADVEKQADEIKKLKEEVARARADYFNLRTRMERDRESNAKLAAEQAVKEMLPVFENLERIAAAINDPESGMAKGMAMVIRQFSDGLCKLGLEFIPTEGPFDPALHEAISMEPVDDESKDGHIIGAVSRGYKLAGRVLKAPQVRVGKYNG